MKLMCVLAHPDDESLGVGGILAKYAAEGVETQLVCATRGEKGWKLGDYPGPRAVGEHRTKELGAAAKVLGLREVRWLDYMDGELDRADPREAVGRIADLMLELEPDVVVSFGPDGAYGHPDHVAVSQFAAAAAVRAAGRGHVVSKFYYLAEPKNLVDAYNEVFGASVARVDGTPRRFEGWEPWALTTEVDTGTYIDVVREAILCHGSQLRNYEGVLGLSREGWQSIFGKATFYRAFSLVNGGREKETDLFAGLRELTYAAT